MPDNLNRKKPEDPNRINVNQQWELEYWSKKFSISIKKLKQAIETAGPMVNNVKKHLDAKS